MKPWPAPVFVVVGAAITVLAGLYGIYARTPTNLGNELAAFAQFQIITLLPFYILFALSTSSKNSPVAISVGAIIFGLAGGWIFLQEMVFSREPSWGFSILIVPIAQLLLLIPICIIARK